MAVEAFADYVRRHHAEDNQLFSDEYAVSLAIVLRSLQRCEGFGGCCSPLRGEDISLSR